MTRREQIIIGLAVLAGLYGAGEYGLRPLLSPSTTVSKTALDTKLVTSLAEAALGDPKRLALVRQILAGPSVRWRQDMFYPAAWDPERAGRRETAGETLHPPPENYSYSGYLRMNEEKIAIINGMDYKQGELLDDYRIETILPDQVILSRGGERYAIGMEETEETTD